LRCCSSTTTPQLSWSCMLSRKEVFRYDPCITKEGCPASSFSNKSQWDLSSQCFSFLPEICTVLSQDMAFMIKRLRTLLGDLTFLEAYERTGETCYVIKDCEQCLSFRIMSLTIVPAFDPATCRPYPQCHGLPCRHQRTPSPIELLDSPSCPCLERSSSVLSFPWSISCTSAFNKARTLWHSVTLCMFSSVCPPT
jgi:hypothetical protein